MTPNNHDIKEVLALIQGLKKSFLFNLLNLSDITVHLIRANKRIN